MSRVYHVEAPVKKHVENSLRGIDFAADSPLYNEIDIDLSITLDGRICGNHWRKPLLHDGFKDPLKRIEKTANFDSLTYAQVRRLIARTGRFFYRIQPIEALVKRAAKRKVGLVLEPKEPDKRFAQDWVWEQLSTLVEEYGAEARVYGFDPSHLAAARRWGFKTTQLKE